MFPLGAFALETESPFKVTRVSATIDEATPEECSTPDETYAPWDDPSFPGDDNPGCPEDNNPENPPGGVDDPGDTDPWWEDPATDPTEPATVAPATQAPEATEPNEEHTRPTRHTDRPTEVEPVTVAPTVLPTYAPPRTDPTELPTSAHPTNTEKDIANASAARPRLNLMTGTMSAGKTLVLYVINSGGKKVKFTSSNAKVAKVSKNGVVTTLKRGFVRITAKVGKYKCFFTLKVISNPKLQKSSVKIKKGKTKKIWIFDKAPLYKLKFKNTKKAKIISKKSKNYVKVKAKKRGKTTLGVRVNGKWLKLKVKVI